MKKSESMSTQLGHIRIIGGRWRSRKLAFPVVEGLRPSPDAVRETLFNWLQSDLPESRCLDLYAGSGAFGFEAASRGATTVVMVEANQVAARQLKKNCDILVAENNITIVNSRAQHFIGHCTEQFDLVFLDPPFESVDLARICGLISKSSILAPGAMVYIESPKISVPLPIPSTWHIIRQKTRGLVRSTLINTEYE
ncbi:MAG: 16S rRNA (guanine(966)-N(2))-methyltransferase RsmD [Arenicellales bacterium]